MFIKKGTMLYIKDVRKGCYKAEAAEDFDTDEMEFYPIVAREYVSGLSNEWFDGDSIPCRKTLAKIEILEEVAR